MKLYELIEQSNKSITDGWTTLTQANAMASMVLALRPAVSVEIGVWYGKGLIPLGLAHKAIGFGKAIGIDPYKNEASVAGQNQEHAKWWGAIDHDRALRHCRKNIIEYDISEHTELVCMTSDEYQPPDGIGVIRIDGNHGEQAMRDVIRFAPKCITGAVMFLDDMNWGNGVVKSLAQPWLLKNGWKELCWIDNGVVMQK